MARIISALCLSLALLPLVALAIRPDQSLASVQGLQAASSCGDFKAPPDCNGDSDCTWCIGKGDIGTSCYAVHMARMLPKRFFTCDNDPRGIVASATSTAAVQGVSECVGQGNATACDELNSCTWCVGQGNVGTACYPVAMARALPKRYFMCDNDSRSVTAQLALRKQEEQEQKEQEEELLKGVSECVHVEDADSCDAKLGCTWCLGQGNVGTDCYPVGAARMLPKRFFTCDNDSRS